MEKLLKYSLILISLIISIGGLIYKIYALNNIGIFLNLFLSTLIFFIIIILNKKVNFKNERRINLYSRNWFIPAVYFFLAVGLILTLIKNSTPNSIISPWIEIPDYFHILYLLATLALLLNIVKKNHLSTLLMTIHYIITFSVAAFVYKLGYGFDPYIHEATINHIIQNGFIAPKTFYYAGYYSLVIALHKIFLIPVFFLNKFIVPIMAGLFLPITIISTLKHWLDNERKIKFTAFALLILPFNIFILSTPQNLAYLFLLFAVLLSLTCKNYLDLILIYLLAFSAFIIQPIAGIPALILAAYLTIFNFDNESKKTYLYSGLFLISSFTLPLLFLTLNKNNLNFNPVTFSQLFNWSKFAFIIPQQQNIWLNTVYLFGFNWRYLLISLTIVGTYLAWKNKKNFPHYFIYSLMLSSSLISYFFILLQPFEFLIDYERSSYANRLLVVAVIFAVPMIILTFYKIASDIMHQNKVVKIILTSALSIIILISLYNSYPRFDNYFNSHGTSTSLHDVKAVQWINNDAQGDYIVLANQQVSAAALHEFEFKKYYAVNNEDVFYYSIPTGGILYEHYLKMIYEKPSKENADKAMDIVGAQTLYFVLNKYWWAFPKILEEAKNEADSFENINNEVYIFRYSK